MIISSRDVARRRSLSQKSAADEILPRSQRRELERRLQNAPKTEPSFVEPMMCKLVADVPRSGEWLYEVKLDGFRALAIKRGRAVSLISRNTKDLSGQYPEIAESVQRLQLRQGTLDGEIAVLDEGGLPSFQALQNLGKTGANRTRL